MSFKFTFLNKGMLVKITIACFLGSFLLGCASPSVAKGKKVSRQESCEIMGNAHELFHKVYLNKSDREVQKVLAEERANNVNFASLLEIRAYQFRDFNPEDTGVILTHSCAKRYYINEYEYAELKKCMSYKTFGQQLSCMDKSMQYSHSIEMAKKKGA